MTRIQAHWPGKSLKEPGKIRTTGLTVDKTPGGAVLRRSVPIARALGTPTGWTWACGHSLCQDGSARRLPSGIT